MTTAETLAASPTSMTFTFAEPLGPTNVPIATCNGEVFPVGDPSLSADRLTATVPVPNPFPKGTCNVVMNVSAPDSSANGAVGITFTVTADAAVVVTAAPVDTATAGTPRPTHLDLFGLSGEVVRNTAFDRQEILNRTGVQVDDARSYGASVRATFGSAQARDVGDWQVNLGYVWLGSDAVPHAVYHPSPAAMLFTRWLTDLRFREQSLDEHGEPTQRPRSSLPRVGPAPSFEALAREVSTAWMSPGTR
mgnify:CR=1 FL=1